MLAQTDVATTKDWLQANKDITIAAYVQNYTPTETALEGPTLLVLDQSALDTLAEISVFPLKQAPLEESELHQYNMQHREPEPEDELLVASGVLDKLLAQAQKELLTEDWEQELAEL
jgi:hypothetical protein